MEIPVTGNPHTENMTPVLAKLVFLLFVVELAIDSTLPYLLPNVRPQTRILADALILSLASGFAVWRNLYQTVSSALRNDRDLVHASMLRLVCNTAIVIFVVELSTMSLVPYLLGGRGGLANRLADSLLTSIVSAPLIWLFVIRSLESSRRFSAKFLYSSQSLFAKILLAFLSIEVVTRGLLHQFLTEDEPVLLPSAKYLLNRFWFPSSSGGSCWNRSDEWRSLKGANSMRSVCRWWMPSS